MKLQKGKRIKKGVKLEKILRVVANNSGGNLSRYRIAKEAGCSQQWGQRVIQRLEGLNFVDGTTLTDFKGFFDYWTKRKINAKRRNYVLKQGTNFLKSVSLKFAATTYWGENLYQGYLFPTRLDIYIDSKEEQKWKSLLSKHCLVGNGNLRVLIADNHVFYNCVKLENVCVVSPPQLIVDLLQEGGPCVEAALMMIEKLSSNV